MMSLVKWVSQESKLALVQALELVSLKVALELQPKCFVRMDC